MRSFRRYEKNPILTANDVPGHAAYFILNPGAVKFNGEYLLIADVFHAEGGIMVPFENAEFPSNFDSMVFGVICRETLHRGSMLL